jgi:hypothetical protein
VTVRGEDAVVVLSAAEYARLAPAASKTTLAALFADSPFARWFTSAAWRHAMSTISFAPAC